MLKKTIKYTNYDGVEQERVYHFNFSRAEVAEMEMRADGGLSKQLQNIVESQDRGVILDIFKDLIQKSYGVKSPDGEQFIKNQQVLDAFVQSEAYVELYMELANNSEKAAEFINAVIPKKKE